MTIRAVSLDMDGCIFHREYLNSRSGDPKKAYTSELYAANQELLDSIKSTNAQYSQNIALIGSNRQSMLIDGLNSERGSCFPAIKSIATYLGFQLDQFLLADVYGDLAAGTSFDRAYSINKLEKDHKDWKFDETKATILYAQMHKIASENPDEEIVFDFYDDRGNGLRDASDILEWLKVFYEKYPELMPSNVTLNLNHYAGGKVTPLATIKGTGIIDANYRQTVKDMAKVTETKGKVDDGKYFTAHAVEPGLLTHRKALRVNEPSQPDAAVKSVMPTHRIPSPVNEPSQTDDAVKPVIPTQKKPAIFPASYQRIWNSQQQYNDIAKIKALLKDYTKESSVLGSFFGRMFTGHWNRHHVSAVHQIVANNQYQNSNYLLQDLKAIDKAENGSLSRRIQFIERQLGIAPETAPTMKL